MKKIIMQGDFQGQDSWGAFKEQVVIDENNNLDYRRTMGGNCEYGKWKEYEGEIAAIKFIFGDFPVSEDTIESFKKDCIKFGGLKDDEFNRDGY